jgi:hypothetical protein
MLDIPLQPGHTGSSSCAWITGRRTKTDRKKGNRRLDIMYDSWKEGFKIEESKMMARGTWERNMRWKRPKI